MSDSTAVLVYQYAVNERLVHQASGVAGRFRRYHPQNAGWIIVDMGGWDWIGPAEGWVQEFPS